MLVVLQYVVAFKLAAYVSVLVLPRFELSVSIALALSVVRCSG